MDINFDVLEHEIKGHERDLEQAKTQADEAVKQWGESIAKLEQIIKDKRALLKKRPKG